MKKFVGASRVCFDRKNKIVGFLSILNSHTYKFRFNALGDSDTFGENNTTVSGEVDHRIQFNDRWFCGHRSPCSENAFKYE